MFIEGGVCLPFPFSSSFIPPPPRRLLRGRVVYCCCSSPYVPLDIGPNPGPSIPITQWSTTVNICESHYLPLTYDGRDTEKRNIRIRQLTIPAQNYGLLSTSYWPVLIVSIDNHPQWIIVVWESRIKKHRKTNQLFIDQGPWRPSTSKFQSMIQWLGEGAKASDYGHPSMCIPYSCTQTHDIHLQS